MSGKGSKPRPMSVSQSEFDEQWDLIFGGKNMKQHERGMITEEVSMFFAPNGKKEASVVKTEKGYMVELYEKSRYVRTVDVSDCSLQYAEDTAENWTLGILS